MPKKKIISSTIPDNIKLVVNEDEDQKEIATVFNVYKNDNIVRVYTVSEHGDTAGSLAQQYADKIGGTVK